MIAKASGRAFHSKHARNVEQHAAPHHAILGFLDAAFLRARRSHRAAVVPVPHVIAVKNVAEPVPLRAALRGHHDHVVRGANFAAVQHARVGVRPGAQHQVDGIKPSHRGIFRLPALRPAMVERQRERNDFALLHEPRRRDDVFRPRVVERANLVVRPPASPIFQPLRRRVYVGHRQLARRCSRFRHPSSQVLVHCCRIVRTDSRSQSLYWNRAQGACRFCRRLTEVNFRKHVAQASACWVSSLQSPKPTR